MVKKITTMDTQAITQGLRQAEFLSAIDMFSVDQ
jgi:hypothetical protein